MKRSHSVDHAEPHKRMVEYNQPAPLMNPLLRECANNLTCRLSRLSMDILRYLIDPMTRIGPGVVPDEMFSWQLDSKSFFAHAEQKQQIVRAVAFGPYGEMAILGRLRDTEVDELRIFTDETCAKLVVRRVMPGRRHYHIAFTTNMCVALYGSCLEMINLDGELLFTVDIPGNKRTMPEQQTCNCIADDRGGVVLVAHNRHSIYHVNADGELSLLQEQPKFVNWLIYARGYSISWEGKTPSHASEYRSNSGIQKALMPLQLQAPIMRKTVHAREDGAGRLIWSYNNILYRTPVNMGEQALTVTINGSWHVIKHPLAITPSGRVLVWSSELDELCYYVFTENKPPQD
jgi:hypothetical protein